MTVKLDKGGCIESQLCFQDFRELDTTAIDALHTPSEMAKVWRKVCKQAMIQGINANPNNGRKIRAFTYTGRNTMTIKFMYEDIGDTQNPQIVFWEE